MSLAPEKVLPSLATVDIDRLISNLGLVRRISRAPKVMAVVKANAYGHGDVAIAQALAHNGADWLAVQTPEEAIKLRAGGVVCPILILGYTHSAYASDILHYQITPTIFDYQLAVELDRLTPAPVPVHIKVDTGMCWAGISVKDSVPFIKSVMKLPKIRISGLFTHFAVADSDPEFTKRQADLFTAVALEAKAMGASPMLHASASSATMNYPEYHFDMVRPGMMLYGVPVGGRSDQELLPILSWTSVVCDMKVIHKGESVGYGRDFIADSTRVIATVPVGYADGWRWNLKNGGFVLVQGKKTKIVGRICMDQFMIDVTDIPGVEVGDRVTLIGKDTDEAVTVKDLSEVLRTTPYEILTGLGGRTKFVYKQSGKEAEL